MSNENDDLVDQSGYSEQDGQPVQLVENEDVKQLAENNKNHYLLDEDGYLRLDGQPVQLAENKNGYLDGNDLSEEPKSSEIRDASKLDRNGFFCSTFLKFELKRKFLFYTTQSWIKVAIFNQKPQFQ